MFYRSTFLLLLFCFVVFTVGCHILLSEQEWSANYALLEGTHSTSPKMIDGDLNSVGQTKHPVGPGKLYGSGTATEVIITLPEKKTIRKIVIHSDNIMKFLVYADKGGTIHSDTDWQLLKEIKMVRTNPVVIPIFESSPFARFRLAVLGTSDAGSLARKDKAEHSAKAEEARRKGEQAPNKPEKHYPARINEIEFFGYKSAQETAAAKSRTQHESEIDLILE